MNETVTPNNNLTAQETKIRDAVRASVEPGIARLAEELQSRIDDIGNRTADRFEQTLEDIKARLSGVEAVDLSVLRRLYNSTGVLTEKEVEQLVAQHQQMTRTLQTVKEPKQAQKIAYRHTEEAMRILGAKPVAMKHITTRELVAGGVAAAFVGAGMTAGTMVLLNKRRMRRAGRSSAELSEWLEQGRARKEPSAQEVED